MSEVQAHESFIEMARKTGAVAPEILDQLATFNTNNAEFFGNPHPWQEYDTREKKEAIDGIDELIDCWQKELDAKNNATYLRGASEKSCDC